MFVQTQETPNPNSLKFIPGKLVSNSGSFEINNKNEVSNDLIRNILSINGVTGIFLGKDFLSVNKKENINWEDLKHIVISFINEYYADGKEWKGEQKDEKYNGQGIYTHPNGLKYIGEWKDGKFIGKIESEGNTDFWGSYDGKWTYYNEDGSIKEVKEYQHSHKWIRFNNRMKSK